MLSPSRQTGVAADKQDMQTTFLKSTAGADDMIRTQVTSSPINDSARWISQKLQQMYLCVWSYWGSTGNVKSLCHPGLPSFETGPTGLVCSCNRGGCG